MICINDLPDIVSLQIFIFEDDIKVFSINKPVADIEEIQRDLDALVK